MSACKKQTFLVIDYLELPDDLREKISERERFQNDCYLEYYSEFEPDEYALGMKVVEDYWEDQKSSNEYMKEEPKKSLEKFIESYGLQIDVWLIEQVQNGLDLTGVEKILIEISW